MKALPFTYRNVDAHIESVVTVNVEGAAGGCWFVERQRAGWQQVPTIDGPAQATVSMPDSVAWKLVTKRRSSEVVRRTFPEIDIQGDQALGGHIFNLLSVMA
jgi:ubiquinone biosynthesis protein UbiJ